MSDVDSFVVDYYRSLMKKCASLEGTERISLSEVLYRFLMPRLIRRMKGTSLGNLYVYSSQIEELFDVFFDQLKINAQQLGHDVERGIQHSSEAFTMFVKMWQKTLFAERDWIFQVRCLIAKRNEYVRSGVEGYPVDLIHLELHLLKINVRMKPIEAAMVLLCWEMSRETQDGRFFLAQRDAARLSAEISCEGLKDDNHAKVTGRAGIEKLKHIGIIAVEEPGTSYKAAGRKEAKATTYRWCFVPEEITERAVRSGSV